MPIVTDLRKYLGMPLLTTMKANSLFTPLVDRINNRIRNWQAKLISQAGRITLTKSILSPLAYFLMQTTLLLVRHLISNRKKTIHCFLWGDTTSQKYIHLLAWATITKTKQCGGLGVRDTKWSKETFLANQAWRLWQNASMLWTNFLKHKHFRRSNFLTTTSKNGSHSWKALLKGRELLTKGLKWVIGNSIWHMPHLFCYNASSGIPWVLSHLVEFSANKALATLF